MDSKVYQSISKYDGTLSGRQDKSYSSTLYGTPEWRGIEYDWEVPSNEVIGSPGGVSTIHHHPTHGFNGRGNISYDIYAGQGERYNSGIYGNLYQTGQESSQAYYGNPPPDYQYWQNLEPSQFSYTHSQEATFAPSMQIYGEPGSFETTPIESEYQIPLSNKYSQKKSPVNKFENYTSNPGGDDSFEILDRGPVDLTSQNDHEKEAEKICLGSIVPSSWQLFIFLTLTFIIMGFWAETCFLFVRQKFHGGEDPTWQRFVIYSIVVTIIFALSLWAMGYPLATN